MKSRKLRFLRAVQILAPRDGFIQRAAARVDEETLPAFPGGAALEFVAGLEKLRARLAGAGAAWRPDRRSKGNGPGEVGGGVDAEDNAAGEISMADGLRVKTAEYWLKLGEPTEALIELEGVSESVRRLPSVVKVQLAALRAAREQAESTVQ